MKYMDEAIKEAEKAFQMGYIPVGAVLVKEGTIIARAHNIKNEHAEMICLKEAQQKEPYLNGMVLYCTLKPCPMCLYASRLARIGKIIYGAENENEPLPKIELIGNIKEEKCKILLKEFFNNIRKN